MHDVKLLGQRLSGRDFDRQVADFRIRVTVLNGFTALAMPLTEIARSLSGERRRPVSSRFVQQSSGAPVNDTVCRKSVPSS
jgi:hypothetical protein